MNPFYIGKPCIKIENSEVLIEQYIMALKRDKYYIEVWYDDAIKRKRIFFGFMQKTFNRLDGLYMDENFILIDTIKKDQLRKHSAAEVEILNREKKYRNKKRKVHLSLLQKKAVFWIRKTEQVEQQKTPPIQILMRTYQNLLKQAIMKKNILECVRVGEKIMLRIQIKNRNEKLVKSKRLKSLSVAEKVTLKL